MCFVVVLCVALASPSMVALWLVVDIVRYCRSRRQDKGEDTRACRGDEVHVHNVGRGVDFGIITVREDEFTAVLERFEPYKTVVGGQRTYALRKMANARGTEVSIAMVRCPSQGAGVAQAVATDMIRDLKPRWLLLVGIAGAFPDTEFTLGDVVISSRVHDFCVSAALPGGKREFDDTGGPLHQKVENLVAHLPAHMAKLGRWNGEESVGSKPSVAVPKLTSDGRLYGDSLWKKKVIDSLVAGFPSAGPPRLPIAHIGSIASSDVLVKDTDLAKQWKESARSVCAIEMELAGICRAARYGDPDCRVLGIRGISDVVGYRRSHEWTRYASHVAAAFCKALIGAGVVEVADGSIEE